jgi:biopolymer transport protein ExbB/TolQ/biopolymer transport protein ExbD
VSDADSPALGTLIAAKETFGDLWIHAGPTAWISLFLLAATTALAVEGLLRFRSRALVPWEEWHHLRGLLEAGAREEALAYCRPRGSFLCAVAEAALETETAHASDSAAAEAERLEEACRRQSALARKPLLWFSLIGVLSPLVGLTGSVVGIARAFSNFGGFDGSGGGGGAAQASLIPLAGAIGPVLTSTACGLLAAIPAFVAYYVFRARADRVLMEAESAAFDLFPELPRHHRARSLRGRYEDDREFGLQIAPLVDLLFVLLLFFMVIAAGRGAESELPLRLAGAAVAAPKAKSAEPLAPLRVEIDAGGQVFLNRAPIDAADDAALPALRARLAEAFAKKAETPVLLIPGAKAKQNRLVDVLRACNSAGARHISLAAPVQ